MDLDKLAASIDKVLQRLEKSERQIDHLKQRESTLVSANEALQEQLDHTQEKIQSIAAKLKLVEEAL